MTDEQRMTEIEKHVNALSEIYDAVQVLGTWLTPDGFTRSQKRGSGNWYARQALCREFLDEGQAETNANAIADKLNSD